MNGKMRTLLIALLCLLMAMPAYAAPQILMESESGAGPMWAGQSNLMYWNNDKGAALCSADGTALTGEMYDDFSYKNGYILANNVTGDALSNQGAFDGNGQIVVPFEYGIVAIKGSEWAIGYKVKKATTGEYDFGKYDAVNRESLNLVFYQADVYHLPEGTKMGEFARENFRDAQNVNHCLNIDNPATGEITTYDAGFNALGVVNSLYGDAFAPADYTTYYENGVYGVMDAAGNVVMQPTYQTVYTPSNGYARVNNGEKCGLINMKGELVVPVAYDSVEISIYGPDDGAGSTTIYGAMGYYMVVKDGKVGFVNEAGEETCPFSYAKEIVQNFAGASLHFTDLESNLRILAADGVETVLEGYSDISPLNHCSGMYYQVRDEAGYLGVIDWHGQVVLPCQYISLGVSGNGQYLIASNAGWNGFQMYKLSYPYVSVEAAEQPATETAEQPAAETAEQPAAEAAEQPATDNSAAASLLNSAITLLNTDAAANRDAVISLLENAAVMLADRSDISGLVSSAITLIDMDATANAAAATALLDNAMTMIK